MPEVSTVQIVSAFWERDDANPSVKLQHGAYIWNQHESGWGYRGRSNPFPRLSFFDPDSYSSSMWQGHREGFYHMCSTINRNNYTPAPVRFVASKATLGNPCFGHPKALTIEYLCIRGANKSYRVATAKENQEISLTCDES
jgi:hypothetical protein